MFNKIHIGLTKASRVAVWCGGGALLLAAIMVTGDVIMRKLFGITLSGADEITGYIFAAAITWAYPYCLLHRSNVRIDALYNYLQPAKRAWLDLLGLILLLIFIALLTIKSVTVFTDSLEFNSTAMTTLATPLWIPQLFWLSGLIFFLFTLVFITCYTLVALLHRDLQTVARIAGVMSVEEELEEEVQGTNIVTKHMPHSQQES